MLQVSNFPGFHCVPILNIPADDYRLRTEVTHCLSKYNIASDLLTFRSEVNLEKLQDNKRLTMTLVDHNVLPEEDARLESSVVDVIDHHKQDREESARCVSPAFVKSFSFSVSQFVESLPTDTIKLCPMSDFVPRTTLCVEPVGSCCTLVAEKLLDDPNFTMDATSAHLLYSE